jgi:RNA polymerase sigma-70 factor (ECF subfamily)
LRSHARALCRDHSAADDLVQETILRALAAEAQWQVDTALRAWLFTIQRHAFFAALRRRRREARHAAEAAAPSPSRQPDTLALRDLAAALQCLPALQHEALILVGGQGLDIAVAAAILFEAALSYLGLGPDEQASWGRLLSDATGTSGQFNWWLAIFPGVIIFLTVLSYNMLGEATRDAIDPKLKKARV